MIMWTQEEQKMNFLVWVPDRGQTREDARRVRANNAETAVVVWAEDDDTRSADYDIVGGRFGDSLVYAQREDGADVVRTFRVSGESVPVYRAREQT